MRHTKKQRDVLYRAWNRGYLSDSKHYGTISKVIGLSRKQVSNWARYQIKKLSKKPTTQRCNTEVSSITKNLPSKGQIANCGPPTRGPVGLVSLDPSEKVQHDEMARWITTASLCQPCVSPVAALQLQPPTNPFAALPCVSVVAQPTMSPLARQITPCSTAFSGSTQLISDVVKPKPTFTNLSTKVEDLNPAQHWLFLNAIETIKEVDDAGVEYLENLSGTRSRDIVIYLLSHSWMPIPEDIGIRYIRT